MNAMEKRLTHIDAAGQPTMVNVGDKSITRRTARARSTVILNKEIMQHLKGEDIQTKKGPVFQTAIIAGIMAAKKTGELIPLCHPLSLENCHIDIHINGPQQVVIDCTAVITAKTGVEMEALTGASIAALTVYDMCKSFSHDILIGETRLLEKTGGKSDYGTGKLAEIPSESGEGAPPPIYGLVLAGGKSTRMQTDKGSLQYHGTTQREYLYHMLSQYCQKVFVSTSREQTAGLEGKFPLIEDRFLGLGPMGGILSALQRAPDKAWMVVACDLPFLSATTITTLMQRRDATKTATAFRNAEDQLPEPLAAIWEPRSYSVLLQFLSQGYTCPRKVLMNTDAVLLQASDAQELRNVNSPEEYQKAIEDLKQAPHS